ncbi:MAG: ATP-binding cassette domain-containing protein [Planctomycetes bacterium]|nr:ATP-binding cassette domain-containing protein [Planctomycetota bacterium]
MIEVTDLTKVYGPLRAVDGASFSIDRGEVVGFLGPNGAGKTTTLRLVIGYLRPDGGRVTVGGYDLATRPIAARRLIGYQPEGAPLPPDLRVIEYLRYRARLKDVPVRERRAKIGEALDRCGVADAARRIIGQLSRGYRQRVALADAVLANPPYLILDEPTVGLDPHQVRQLRALVRELARDHTVFLSTHILSEVELVCDRVLIIHRGRIVARGTPEVLRRRVEAASRIRVEFSAAVGSAAREIGELPGVAEARAEDGGGIVVRAREGADPREAIFRLAAARNWPLRELVREAATLEDAFVAATDAKGEARPAAPGAGGEGP